jgi:hypothetical protein
MEKSSRVRNTQTEMKSFYESQSARYRLITCLLKQEKSESEALRQLFSKVFGDYSNIKDVYLAVSVHVCVGVPSYITVS